MVSLGIDPSLSATGLFMLSDEIIAYEEIKTKKLRGAPRLSYMVETLSSFLETLPVPNILVMEGPSYGSKGNHHEIGEGHGVLKLALFQRFQLVPVIVTPGQLKKYATGRGNLPKAEKKTLVIKAVEEEFSFHSRVTDNIADAAVLAMIGRAILKQTTPEFKYRQDVLDVLKTNQEINYRNP